MLLKKTTVCQSYLNSCLLLCFCKNNSKTIHRRSIFKLSLISLLLTDFIYKQKPSASFLEKRSLKTYSNNR